MVVAETVVIETIIGICFLVFMAKVITGICTKYKVSEVVGEVLARFLFGPYTLGGTIFFLFTHRCQNVYLD